MITSQIENAIDKMPLFYRVLYRGSFMIYLMMWGAGYFPIQEYLAVNLGINNAIAFFGAGILVLIPIIGSIVSVWASHVTSFEYPIWVGVIQFILLPIGAKLIRSHIYKKAILEYTETHAP